MLAVVMLLPGFAYLVGKERHGTERRLSSFREPVAVVAASITSELVVIGLFALVRILWPSITPDVGALVRHSSDYLRGTATRRGHYALVAEWATGLLAVATLGAYLATKPSVRRRLVWATGPYPHSSTVSAWWVLFAQWQMGRRVEVACVLDDESRIRGQFGSFNPSAEDSPDRDLILKKPIFYRPPGNWAEEIPYPAGAVAVSARRVVALFVTYVDVEKSVKGRRWWRVLFARARTATARGLRSGRRWAVLPSRGR